MFFSKRPARTNNSIGPSSDGSYVEDLFSAYAYNGNGTTNNIVNNINLFNNKGLVWIKNRNSGSVTPAGDRNHWFYDNIRGNKYITPTTSTGVETANTTSSSGLLSFNSDGFTVGDSTDTDININGGSYISYTLRAAPNFFDIVTFTSSPASGGTTVVPHALGTMPGLILLKYLDNSSPMYAFHNNLSPNQYLTTYSTGIAQQPGPIVGFYSTTVSFTNLVTNQRCVIYIFPLDGNGFGADKSQSIIKTGTFTITSNYPQIDLGFEPQFLLYKGTTISSSWYIIDKIKGLDKQLYLNSATGQSGLQSSYVRINSRGFKITQAGLGNGTLMYLAIRGDNMRTPTVANTVFNVNTYTGSATTSNTIITTNFTPDMTWSFNRTNSLRYEYTGVITERYFDGFSVRTVTADGFTYTGGTSLDLFKIYESPSYSPNRSYLVSNLLNRSSNNYVSYAFKKAAGFFDLTLYEGTGTLQNVNHNLGVKPELIFIKLYYGRNPWAIYSPYLFNPLWDGQPNDGKYNLSFASGAASIGSAYWYNKAATSTQFSVNSSTQVNQSGQTYLAFMFATCPGVSKVGYYTGTGAEKTINCGFSNGARFVLIKNMFDASTQWVMWDTNRGMTTGIPNPWINSGDDVYNGTEVFPLSNVLYSSPTGFTLRGGNVPLINGSGKAYLFLAIA